MRTFIILVLLSILVSCGEGSQPQPEISNDGLKILPVGDSRVEGARPEFESYRYELWKNLVTDGAPFDFIGPYLDPGSYNTFMDLPFDTNHAGVGGHTTRDVINDLSTILSKGSPDIILLGIGGNDLLGEVPVNTIISNYNQIIDAFQENNSNVTILIEQIAPGRSDINTTEVFGLFKSFNEEVAALAIEQSTNASPVIAIDMAKGWNDSFMADEVHYNTAGAKEIADRYYSELAKILMD